VILPRVDAGIAQILPDPHETSQPPDKPIATCLTVAISRFRLAGR
jgi:hypothetical protein